MLTREELQTAQDLLAAAEQEFALGNLEAGSKRIGDAAVSAVKAVAKRLDAELGEDSMSIRLGLTGALAGASRVRHGLMEPEDAWADMMSVRHSIGVLQQLDD